MFEPFVEWHQYGIWQCHFANEHPQNRRLILCRIIASSLKGVEIHTHHCQHECDWHVHCNISQRLQIQLWNLIILLLPWMHAIWCRILTHVSNPKIKVSVLFHHRSTFAAGMQLDMPASIWSADMQSPGVSWETPIIPLCCACGWHLVPFPNWWLAHVGLEN